MDNNIWDSYEILLLKIRANPEKYLPAGFGEPPSKAKSLKNLMLFLNGYKLRCTVEIWEREIALEYFEHYNSETYKNLPDSHANRGGIEWVEFMQFVHKYYGTTTSYDGVSLISSMSDSEEEAFDKYFELRDKYLSLSEEEIKTIIYGNDEESFMKSKKIKDKNGLANAHPRV